MSDWFAVNDRVAGAWVISSDAFDLLAGSSSRDIRLQESLTLAGISSYRRQLDRLSPLRDWLAHPATRAHMVQVLSALQRQFLGDEADLPTEGPENDGLMLFIGAMPIAKLVMFGGLSEQELAQLIAAANGHESGA